MNRVSAGTLHPELLRQRGSYSTTNRALTNSTAPPEIAGVPSTLICNVFGSTGVGAGVFRCKEDVKQAFLSRWTTWANLGNLTLS